MKYLGVDWGIKKIGLAISEGTYASPLTILSSKSLDQSVKEIINLVVKEKIDQVIIGQAEGLSGSRAAKAIKALQKQGINVIRWDETLSTYQAKQMMIAVGTKRSDRKDDDAFSAAIILQSYLDDNQELA